jgi:GNAT superfamily N-acetyltransferase
VFALVVREAAPEDGTQIAELLTELGRSAATTSTLGVFQRELEAQLMDPLTKHLVAELDAKVVGFCSLHFQRRLNRLRLQACIPDLIVTASARGHGAGRALLERAVELSREARCWSVKLDSGHSRREAHELYRSAGMKDAGIYFELELEPDL